MSGSYQIWLLNCFDWLLSFSDATTTSNGVGSIVRAELHFGFSGRWGTPLERGFACVGRRDSGFSSDRKSRRALECPIKRVMARFYVSNLKTMRKNAERLRNLVRSFRCWTVAVRRRGRVALRLCGYAAMRRCGDGACAVRLTRQCGLRPRDDAGMLCG